MKFEKVNSGNIESVGYSREARQMVVEMKDGVSLVFHHVEEPAFHAFMTSPNIDHHYLTRIRPHYLRGT